MSKFEYPILYTFRRCPYAMRARFVLRHSHKKIELREIKLQKKPKDFLNTSPKGTVPVLALSKKEVLDQSLDIMMWCLQSSDNSKINDLKNNLPNNLFDQIKDLDNEFKTNLDKYKYPNRFKDNDKNLSRDNNLTFLKKLNENLKNSIFLNSNKIGLLDYAIFPFIRQFRNVDIEWFENLNLSFLNSWYLSIVESKAFFDIMKKYKVWDAEDKPIITNFNYN